MTFLKIIFLAILLILIGGFTYFAIIDVNIAQTDKTEVIKPPKNTN